MPKKTKDSYDGLYERSDTRLRWWGTWTDAQGRRKRRGFDVSTRQQAQSALAAERHKVEEEIKFGRPLLTDDTFEGYSREFLAHQERRISSRGVAKGKLSQAEFKRQEGIVKHLTTAKAFKGKRLASIRKADVLAYIHDRTGKISDATIIKEVNVLKRMFNLAVDMDKLSTNPAQRAPLPQAPEGRNRYLTNEELHKVLMACELPKVQNDKKEWVEQKQWLKQAAGLAVALGTRRGELLGVTLADIDIDTRVILLRQTKNGKPRPAFINDLAMQVLDTMGVRELKKRKGRGLLFPDVNAGNLSVYFVRACKKAGIDDFSFHDLRHTYASHLRMNGADLHDIQKMLGHSDTRMTNRYAHLSNAHLDTTAQRLNGVLTLPALDNDTAGLVVGTASDAGNLKR